MKDIKCPCCGKNIITLDGVKDADRWNNYIGIGCLLVGGPFTMGVGAFNLGIKAFKKHVCDEVDVKCPHCKKKITLTKAQWKEIKSLINELQTKDRQSKQNRL